MRSLARRSWLLPLVLIVINTLAYGYVFRVPYMLDDVIHFRWLSEHDIPSILNTAAGLSYYRPLNFLIWKVFWLMQGQYHGPTLHAINFLAHQANTLLVFALLLMLRRPTQSPVLPFASAVLFALYPLSYQAVPWVGSLAHVSVTSLILAALVLALFARRARTNAMRVVAEAGALLCTFLAPFAHEVGMMTVPLLVLITFTDSSAFALRPNLKTLTRAWLPFALLSALAVATSLSVRANTLAPTKITVNDETLYQNSAYFLQALAYPVAPLGWLLHPLGLDDLQSIYVVCGLAVLLWLWVIWRSGARRSLLLALGWFAICALPSWALLRFSYIIDGPRLLYQASMGIALFWLLPLDQLSATRHIGQRIVALALPIIALGGSIWFLQERTAMYLQSIRMTEQLLALTTTQTPGPYLLVNYPRWIAPKQAWFPVGHEGISVVPEYASMFDYYWTISGREIPIEDVFVEDIKKPWRFNYALVGNQRSSEDMQGRIRNNARTIFADLSTPNIIVYDAGQFVGAGVPKATDYIAAYDGGMAVITGTLHYDKADHALFVDLIWQSWQKLPHEMNTFVHVQKPTGELVAQTDGFPIANLARPSFWQVGDEWRERRLIPLPIDLPAGDYMVRVGVYPSGGGDRVKAVSAAGERYENDSALVGKVSVGD